MTDVVNLSKSKTLFFILEIFLNTEQKNVTKQSKWDKVTFTKVERYCKITNVDIF